MEKMDPPESTSGTGALDPSDGGDGSEVGERADGAGAAVHEDAVRDDAPDDSELAEDLAAVPEEAEAVAPPVVVVMVTSGAGAWLEPALASLAAQDYPALSVLVLDNAAATDPTGRIAAVLPTAYVRRLAEDRGFAAAANEALETVEGATFLLFCHDDVALDPDAVRVMVEEAYRSNAAIVGPKLVDYEHPDVLIEVGMSVDHYGVPFSAIEPGEIDQEQHDGVRDVFFVSHAVMLVRADLFRELGGFDPKTSPGSDDIDLCWRARLAGARVLVAPASRVRHRRATTIDERRTRRQAPRDARDATRGRVRVLYKSYSAVALIWVLPSGFVLTVGEAAGLALTRRARHAAAVILGWIPARGGLSDLRKARASTQQMRQVDDADVRDLMVRGSARFRSLFVQRLHAGDRLADASNRARARMANTSEQMRRAPAIVALLVGLLMLVGSRALLFQRIPDIGSFQAWPGVGSLWSTFTSPWRYTMLGGSTPASPAFALMAAFSTVLLGHAALARAVVIVGALPLGACGVYRLARTLTAATLPTVVAAVAYALNPVGRDAIARGDLGPLVLYALAPFILHALVRVSPGVANREGPSAHARVVPKWRYPVRAVVVVGVLGAVAGSVWPPAILLAALLAVTFVIALPFAWGEWTILRTAGLALGGAVVSVVLLSPWSWSLIGADASTLGLRPRPPLAFGDVLRFDVGPARAGWFTLGLVVMAAVPLVIASGSRLVWAARAWVLTLASFALVWLPSRVSATASVAAPEGVLVPAALGVAVAAGLGAGALLDDMRRSRFGWRQVSAVAVVVGLALPLLPFAADIGSGSWQLPSADWPTSVSWMGDLPSAGGFRVLWLGDPAALPVDAKEVDGVGFGFTSDGTVDARTLLAASARPPDDLLARALAAARGGDTARLGHLLAPLGVRYVVLVSRMAPGHGEQLPADPMLTDALTRQLDLSVSRVDDGGIVYSNDAWIPRRAVVPADQDVTVARSASADAVLGAAGVSEAGSVARGVAGRVTRSAPVGPGTLLWSEASSSGWQARAGRRDLTRSTAFGWANAFALPVHASVSLHYSAGRLQGVLVLLEVVLWLVALEVWRRTRVRRRRAPRVEAT